MSWSEYGNIVLIISAEGAERPLTVSPGSSSFSALLVHVWCFQDLQNQGHVLNPVTSVGVFSSTPQTEKSHWLPLISTLKSHAAGVGPGICSTWDIFQLSQEALCPVREMGVGEEECGVETCLGYTADLQHGQGWSQATWHGWTCPSFGICVWPLLETQLNGFLIQYGCFNSTTRALQAAHLRRTQRSKYIQGAAEFGPHVYLPFPMEFNQPDPYAGDW